MCFLGAFLVALSNVCQHADGCLPTRCARVVFDPFRRCSARSPGRHVTDRDDAPVHVSFLSPRERMAATKRQAADDAAAAMRSHVVSNAMDGRSTERVP